MSVNILNKEDLIQEQILQAAKRLFAVHGLAKVTMDDVAKAIGKGRSSLYYYYKSKDEIFDAVVKVEINEMLSAMEKASQSGSTEDKIRGFCMAKLQVVRDKWSFFDALESGMDADAISNFNKTKIAHHDLIMKREGALLSRILTAGIKSRELTAINEEDLDNLIFVLLASLHGLKREMRIENNVRVIEPVIAQFTRLVMQGLAK